MKSTLIKKIDNVGEDKAWSLIDEKSGHQVTVIFSKNLEKDLHRRNHSFDRLQSEQLNAVLNVMSQLDDHNYILEVNQENIGNSIIPLTQERLLRSFKLV